MKNAFPPLYLVTARAPQTTEAQFLATVAQACEGGVGLVQLREKELPGLDYFHLAQKIKAVTDHYGVPLIIDDRADIALAVDAAGVHVGQEDLPVAATRRILGPGKMVGATTKTLQQALAAQAEGANYLGVGAIFPTTTKVKTVRTSVETLREITATCPLPVYAIGGLNAQNLQVLHGSGATGIAVVSALMASPNPKEAAEALRAGVDTLCFAQAFAKITV